MRKIPSDDFSPFLLVRDLEHPQLQNRSTQGLLSRVELQVVKCRKCAENVELQVVECRKCAENVKLQVVECQNVQIFLRMSNYKL
jgi:hypothetical protein